jgi:hypothetical protein
MPEMARGRRKRLFELRLMNAQTQIDGSGSSDHRFRADFPGRMNGAGRLMRRSCMLFAPSWSGAPMLSLIALAL